MKGNIMPAKKNTTTKKTVKSPPRLYRSESNRMLAGVAGGLGEYFNIDPVLIRILFVLLTIFGGSGILLYLILWIIIPSESSTATPDKTVAENTEELKEKADEVGRNLRANGSGGFRTVLGFLFIFFGGIWLLQNFGFIAPFDIGRLWPLFLIILGFSIILR